MSRRKFIPAPNTSPHFIGEHWIPEEWIEVTSLDLTDIDIYEAGAHQCPPGYICGPLVRDHYLIHYILSGKGTYQSGTHSYTLTAGQGFLIFPDTVAIYQADAQEPWNYAWIGFHGLKVEHYLKLTNLSLKNPIFQTANDTPVREYFLEMLDTQKMKKGREVKLLGLLYLVFSQLMETGGSKFLNDTENPKEIYIKKYIEIVAKNYSRSVNIGQIAQNIGIDRRYLSSIFKERLNLSPQEFLINFRMNKACELMENRQLSISDIARSVGYEDPLQFSKIFKKMTGKSPTDYRKNVIQDPGRQVIGPEFLNQKPPNKQ